MPRMTFALLVIMTLHSAGAVAQTEERIARIEAAVFPPFVISGETPTTPSLAERMKALRVPGVSVAVIHEGALAWAKGYGFADVESGRPVTTTTLFQAASISKPLAAMGALHLVERGWLNLDTDVNTYLRTWHLPDNEFTARAPVTLRGLLTHTAGTTVWGFPGYSRTTIPMPSTVDVLEGRGNTDPIRVYKTPGESWQYSGGGYTVMQLVISDLVHQPFAQFMQQVVLDPLGMTNSTYRQPLPPSRHREAASGYRDGGNRVEGAWHVYPEMAAAGLWTTASDLALYVMAVQNAYHGRGNPLLSSSMVEQMLEPGLNNWGLGVQVDPDDRRFGHGGANEGFRAIMTGFLDLDEGAVIMTNSDNGGQLANELLGTIALAYGWPALTPEEKMVADLSTAACRAVAGTYLLNGAVRVEVTCDQGRIWVQPPTGPAQEILPESELDFFARTDGMPVRFVQTNGEITGIVVEGREGRRIRR